MATDTKITIVHRITEEFHHVSGAYLLIEDGVVDIDVPPECWRNGIGMALIAKAVEVSPRTSIVIPRSELRSPEAIAFAEHVASRWPCITISG